MVVLPARFARLVKEYKFETDMLPKFETHMLPFE